MIIRILDGTENFSKFDQFFVLYIFSVGGELAKNGLIFGGALGLGGLGFYFIYNNAADKAFLRLY